MDTLMDTLEQKREAQSGPGKIKFIQYFQYGAPCRARTGTAEGRGILSQFFGVFACLRKSPILTLFSTIYPALMVDNRR
tara:strand:+ start:94 stop:330 length:237 start_codon:yes stop_codon:yes gene_type:complete